MLERERESVRERGRERERDVYRSANVFIHTPAEIVCITCVCVRAYTAQHNFGAIALREAYVSDVTVLHFA